MLMGAAGEVGQAPRARMGCWQWQYGPGASWAPLGSHSPGYTAEKGSELCGPVHVLVSPGLSPSLSMARQGLSPHSHGFGDLVGHQALESRLASPRGDQECLG